MFSFNVDLFKEFISSNCNRGEFIQNFLENYGISAPAINLTGKKHIYVKFPNSCYDKKYKIKTVIAHYDRVENSPGANDNSMAVFCMMNWAVELFNSKKNHNIRLIFTDGEELGEQGVKSQGAYELGLLFKKLGLTEDEIFVFDSMGRGNIPVICQTQFSDRIPKEFIERTNKLELKAERILTSAAGKFVKLPTNLSDNAGFIANGIPAVAITMLPFEEISLYKKGLSKYSDKNSIDFINYIPETWKMFHTTDDNFENLSSEAYEITKNILNQLALTK